MRIRNEQTTVTLTSFSARRTGISSALDAIAREPFESSTARESQNLVVCPVRHGRDLEEVYRITHDGYVALGYCDPRPDGKLIHYPHLDGIPETTVLVALLDGQVVGTNSLTLDGPQGLHVDHDFKPACDAIRSEGRRLAASWRIGTRNWVRQDARVVFGLIQATLRLGLQYGMQTCVFTFQTRHERIYQKLLNLRTVARMEASATGLRNGSTVFMRLDREHIPAPWLNSPEPPRTGHEPRKA